MAYNKHTWVTGETITAEKPNNIEDGVATAGGILKLAFTEDPENESTYVCDHTWQEIYDALAEGIIVISASTYEDDGEIGAECNMICLADNAMGGFNLYVNGNISDRYAIASTADGYPSYGG